MVVHTYIDTYTCLHVHTYMCAHRHAHIHTYIHTYIHTHTHTYIQTYINQVLVSLNTNLAVKYHLFDIQSYPYSVEKSLPILRMYSSLSGTVRLGHTILLVSKSKIEC